MAARFSSRINGLTNLALTRLDVLDDLPSFKICVGYKVSGETISHFPGSITTLEGCQPVYEELKGWQSPTSDIRDYEKLPAQAKQYVARLEEIVSCPVSIISVGARREQTIHKAPIL